MITSRLCTYNAHRSSQIFNVVARAHLHSGVPISLTDLPEHKSLVLESYGEAKNNLVLRTREAGAVLPKELDSKMVLVEHLAAMINPADLNFMQGVYGHRPQLPTIAGGEGILRIKQVGKDVEGMKPGNLVIGPTEYGHWQSFSVRDSRKLFRVDDELDISVAAQLKVNPCTAYRMIKDFSNMDKGDVLIQNGANSAVGMYVIQLAKHWGIKTVNIIRDRPDKEKLVNDLKGMGADIVLTEAQVSDVTCIKPILAEVGNPKLFLNCVGGKNAIDCQKTLAHGGYSVTYGAMSRQPFNLSAASLIFKDHKFVGFWVSRWFKDRETTGRDEVASMLNELSGMFKSGSLRSKSTTMIKFEDRNIAFDSTSHDKKYLFLINE